MKKVKISPIHLQYWCRTSVIDEIVCERKGIAFNKQLADEIEKTIRHYFVMDKKGNSTTVPGIHFEAYFNDKNVELKDRKPAPECPMTEGAKAAIDLFIKQIFKI